jgi:hypothetical protein
MKKLFFGFALCATIAVQATVRTVSNFPTNVAQFSTIQAAIAVSANGDTIYVHGSPNQYAGFTINALRLTIIGPGWTPNKQLPFDAVVNTDIAGTGVQLTGTATSGTEIQGMAFVGSTGTRINTSAINNLLFVRNHYAASPVFFSGAVSPGTWSGYLFEGCLINNGQVRSDNPTVHNFSNFIFQNNLFYETGCCVAGNISGFTNTSNILFDHNLWFGTSSGTRDCFVGNCRFLTITNNIFVRRNASSANSSSTFTNNITFYPAGSTNPGAPWTLNGNTNSGGNVDNQDPQMTTQTNVNAGTFVPTGDFTIAAGPANNAASDGKDMGLLFDATGSLNWTNSRTSRLPFIFSMNVTTPTVAPGGNVSVTVEARRNN